MSPTATASASAIIAQTSSGYHHLKIHGYSSLTALPVGHRLSSCPFTVGGHLWRIDYYPNGDREDSAGHISVYLVLHDNVTNNVTAQFRFGFEPSKKRALFFLNNNHNKVKPPPPATPSYSFASQGALGYPKFVQLGALENSKFLKNDSFTIRCDVVVIDRVRVEGKGSADKKEIPEFVKVPPPDLSRHLAGLLLAERGADVVFEAGGETFAAHRCVLAARSPVFSAELFGSMKEGNTANSSVLRVHDMEPQVFKALLCFLYTDSLPEMEKEEEDVMCQHLLVAADKYAMERMKLVCEDRLCKYIHVNTVANILALAQMHSCAGLKSACVHFLTSPGNLRAAMDSDGFHHLTTTCPSLLKELITMSVPN
jgi:speckle-type POZ protein